MPTEMDEVVKEFLVESTESLDRVDRELVALEQSPEDPDRIGSVFRTIHTIKGTCGFLGFSKLEALAHAGEGLLARLRDGQLKFDGQILDSLLQMVDAIREMLGTIEADGHDGEREHKDLIASLNWLTRKDSPEEAARAAAGAQGRDAPAPKIKKPGGGTGEFVVGGSASDSYVRVSVAVLDKLMNLVGELVLARNHILQFSSFTDNPDILATTQRLNLVASELQEGVMKTRMQPISNVWSKLPRVVREVALSCGKQVRLEMEGGNTELDRTIIDAIKDPLMHVVRNAIDHGIETPSERIARHKPPEGLVYLRAFHEGGRVNIEICDDGRGMDLERIKQKALQKGLLSGEEATRMNERDVLGLIFLPGFSTADQVTHISGRGVGMDVVRSNVERIGGTVDIHSEPGAGTILKLKIPLTLAIIPALIVTSSGERYAIPQANLVELVRVEGEQAYTAIERTLGTPVFRLRGQLLPMLTLSQELALDDSDTYAAGLNVVVLRAEERQFGLVVDDISDTQEIVVKPLAKQIKGLPMFAGATIMGDGKVALILDVRELAHKARLVSDVGGRSFVDRPITQSHRTTGGNPLLLVELDGRGRVAVPLTSITRLEELDPATVEQIGGREVIQHRGEIIPLIRLGAATADRPAGEPLPVLICNHMGRPVGVTVDRVLDIVEDAVPARRTETGADSAAIATAVIQDRVTELLDLASVVDDNAPALYLSAPIEEQG